MRFRSCFVALVMVAGLLWSVMPAIGHVTSMQESSPESQNREQRLLSLAGFDLDLFNHVVNRTVETFVEEEFFVFAEMAKVVKHYDANPPAESAQPFDLVKVLQNPRSCIGDYVRVKGTVRRSSRIEITSPRLRKLTGHDYYYHVDLFVPTEADFVLKESEGEIWIRGSYGITMILFDMPDEMSEADKYAMFSIPCFYLKNWSHKTVDSREVSAELRRPNPVVFGLPSQVKVLDFSKHRDQVGSLIGLALLVLLGLVGAVVIWQIWNARQRSPAASKKQASVDFAALNDIDSQIPG